MALIDNMVTRLPNGVTNRPVSDIFNSLRMSDPTRYHTFFDDFDKYVAADWTVTSVGTTPTRALANGDGGLLLLTISAADDDSTFLQKVGESFLMEAGKKAFFAARLKVSDATQSDFVIGLQITDTTPFDATDGIYFIKADGAATASLVTRKNATTGSVSGATAITIADDTFITLKWFYDGVDRLYYGYNDTIVGYVDASSTYLPDTTLTISFGLQNGEAVAKTSTLDYIYAAKER